MVFKLVRWILSILILAMSVWVLVLGTLEEHHWPYYLTVLLVASGVAFALLLSPVGARLLRLDGKPAALAVLLGLVAVGGAFDAWLLLRARDQGNADWYQGRLSSLESDDALYAFAAMMNADAATIGDDLNLSDDRVADWRGKYGQYLPMAEALSKEADWDVAHYSGCFAMARKLLVARLGAEAAFDSDPARVNAALARLPLRQRYGDGGNEAMPVPNGEQTRRLAGTWLAAEVRRSSFPAVTRLEDEKTAIARDSGMIRDALRRDPTALTHWFDADPIVFDRPCLYRIAGPTL